MKSRLILFLLLISAQLAFSQCFPDRHNTSWNDAWISCERTPNPNEIRGNSHWLHYDTHNTYAFGQITFWNYNDPAHLDRGLNEIVIDYSLDGVEWLEFGTFTLEQADGSAFYEGSLGPDLAGLQAKEILITALSNHGSDCYGLSEIKIEVIDHISKTDDPELNVNLVLSPVPTKDVLNVELSSESIHGDINYTIVDMQGKLFISGVFSKNGNSHLESLNVASLASGQYVLELITKDAKKAKSFNVIK